MSRLLAYSTDRMGVPKALGGTHNSGITEKLIPAVAKFAQDGSQDARDEIDKNFYTDTDIYKTLKFIMLKVSSQYEENHLNMPTKAFLTSHTNNVQELR